MVALIAAGLIVGTGIRAREEQGTRLKDWTEDQAIPTVATQVPLGGGGSVTQWVEIEQIVVSSDCWKSDSN